MSSDLPAPQGLYDPSFEHDSCGVNFVVHMKGERSHDIVADPTLADAILDRVLHTAHRIELRGESLRRKATARTPA